MSRDSEIRPLLQKFIRNECNEQELEQVVAYFQRTQQSKELPSVDDVKELLGKLPSMDSQTSDRVYAKVIKKTRQHDSKKKQPLWRYASVAALFLAVFGLGYVLYQNQMATSELPSLVPANDAITLELDNGEIKVIDENGTEIITTVSGQVVGQQQQNKLTYDGDASVETLAYNTLTVPYGKRFDIELSDGSTIFLNAGTKLRYPIRFLEGQNRQVFLEGEAFFKVAKDAKHPFIVNADALDVQVLGTEFNVSHYPEDASTEVVLVEGSVGMHPAEDVFDTETDTVLEPGNKGSFERSSGDIETKEVLTSTYTAWVDGELVFRNMPFDNILKKLERHYNIDIINKNRELGEEEFNASFSDYSIDEVLKSLKENYGIAYTIENNQVLIE